LRETPKYKCLGIRVYIMDITV